MQFTLVLDMPDAEQEAVWLQARIHEDDIPGLRAEVVKVPVKPGAMSGNTMTEILNLAATTAVVEGIKSLIGLLFNHFKGKPVKLELTGICPDTGRQLKLSFDTSGEKSRDAAIAEFERNFNALCGSPVSSTLPPAE